MPAGGSRTLVVAAPSYAGQICLTAVACRDCCPDLEMFARGMRSAPQQPHCPAGSAAVIGKPEILPAIVKEKS
jgi:hypothetical protein